MIGHRCRKCIWWDNQHDSVRLIPLIEAKKNPGFCRRRKPGAILLNGYFYGAPPVMDAEEFCGEFKGEG